MIVALSAFSEDGHLMADSPTARPLPDAAQPAALDGPPRDRAADAAERGRRALPGRVGRARRRGVARGGGAPHRDPVLRAPGWLDLAEGGTAISTENDRNGSKITV
jgi:hypothetical protein